MVDLHLLNLFQNLSFRPLSIPQLSQDSTQRLILITDNSQPLQQLFFFIIVVANNLESHKLNNYFGDELTHSVETSAESLAERDEVMGEDDGLSLESEVNVIDIE